MNVSFKNTNHMEIHFRLSLFFCKEYTSSAIVCVSKLISHEQSDFQGTCYNVLRVQRYIHTSQFPSHQ